MWQHATHIHCIGAGGIGVSAVMKFLHLQEKTVTGSDATPSEITQGLERMGMQIHNGHDEDHLAPEVNLVIFSSAVPEANPERQAARDRGIKQLSYFEFLGELSKEFSTIVVTGTHGKSTTTALLGLMLEAGGYDPTVVVGSQVASFKHGNLRSGNGRFLVLEGCEYQANMLHLQPEMIVLTNIEHDHPDFYRDLKHTQETFQQFIDKRTGQGMVIWNHEDPASNELSIDNGVSFSTASGAHYWIENHVASEGQQVFDVYRQEDSPVHLGSVTFRLPGYYNVRNAMAALAGAMELGIPFETCKRVLEEFVGIWRRYERLGQYRGAELISDYGHHPTAVKNVLGATRDFFPNRRVVLCYQPHQHARTQELFKEFVQVLPAADVVILSEIYGVTGRTEEASLSSDDLVTEIKRACPKKEIVFARDLAHARELIDSLVQEGDVLLVQGAGTIDELARDLRNDV